MRIDRVELENWMSYPRRWPTPEGLAGTTEGAPLIDLTTESLTLITGSNGSGKSAILEAICYALFAKYPRSKNTDAIRTGEKEAKIKLHFSLPVASGEVKYCVERLLSGRSTGTNATLKQFNDTDKEIVLETGQEKVTYQIEKLLRGITYEAFVSTVFLRQEQAGKFMELDPQKQREQLLSLCRLEIYEQIYKKAKSLREKQDAEVGRLASSFEQVEYATAEYLAAHKEKTQQLHEQQAKMRNKERAAIELLENVKRVNVLTKEIFELQQTLEEWRTVLEQAEQIRYAAKWLITWDRVRHTLEEARATQQRIGERENEIEQVELALTEAKKAASDLEHAYEELEAKYKTENQKLNQIRDKLPLLIQEEQAAERNLRRTKEAKELDEEITRIVAEQSERETQLVHFEEVKQKHLYTDLLKQAQTALLYFLSKLVDAQAEQKTADKKDDEAEQITESANELSKTLPDKQDRLETLNAEIGTLQSIENDLNGTITGLEDIIRRRNQAMEAGQCPTCGLEMTGSAGEHVHAEVDDLQRQVEAAEEQLLETGDSLRIKKAEVEALGVEISEQEKQINRLVDQAKLVREAAAKARNKARTTQEQAIQHWQQHLATWQEMTIPDWLITASTTAQSHIEQELRELAGIDQEYKTLVGVQASFKAEGKVLLEHQRRRNNLSVASPISDAELAELENVWQEAQECLRLEKEERDQLDESVKALEPKVVQSKEKVGQAQQETSRIEKKLGGLKASQQTDQANLIRTKGTLQSEYQLCQDQFPNLAEDLLPAVDDTEAKARLDERVISYTETADRLEQLQEAETRSTEVKAAIKLKQDELYDLSKKVGDVSEPDALQHLADLQHDLKQLDQEVSEADQLLGQIKVHHQQRQELEPQLSTAKRAKWAYQQIEEALYPGTATRSPGPLQAQITEKLMESIGQEASKILAGLGWYMSVTYSKNGGFSVHDRTHGVTRSYDTYSGGERFAIAIAIALAVGRVTHGAGNIRCLFIDEGFGALDAKNRGRIITEAIGKLIENEWRDQVVIITHLEDMKGYFPRKIELVRQNDCSMLVTELEG